MQGTAVDRINKNQDVHQQKKPHFVIACEAPAKDELAEIVHALYYLPHYYRLIITDALWQDIAEQKALERRVQDEGLMARVTFDSEAGKSNQMSPFSFADMVLYRNGQSLQEERGSTTPRLLDISGTQTPEALASAILKAARA